MPTAQERFTHPLVLVCEGNEDKAFFERLIQVRGLPNFHVRTTANDRGEAGGNTKFSPALERLRIVRNFAAVEHILLVTDADDDANRTFKSICNQIENAGFGPAPTSVGEASKARPAITVMTVPVDQQTGCLENILEAPARNADPKTASYVDNFIALVCKNKWTSRRKAKAWLRVNLAARATDPFVFLGQVFRDSRFGALIPLTDSSLDQIASVLRSIASRSGRVDPDPSLKLDGEASPAGLSRNRPRTRTRRPGK
jgi:hypothetical protein